MRYVRIFLLHFQYVFERRGVSLVWFLIALFDPLIFLFFWKSVLTKGSINGWSLSSVASYYFLLIIASAMLMSHIEDDVAHEDIEQGQLVKYIIKPFSYYWINFIREIPYRLLQGFFGIIVCLFFVNLFGQFFTISSNIFIILLSFITVIFAFMLSHVFKMVLGLTAFWFTDARGFYSFIDIAITIFAGYILPLDLMPDTISRIAKALPFSYMIYYPVISFQGKLPLLGVVYVICNQLLWIGIFAMLYRFLWNKGIRKFTGMGQ